jgi:hypothetical protein
MPAVSRPYYGSDILQTNNTHHYSNHALAFPKKLHSLLSGTLDLTTNLNWMLLRGRSMPEVSRMNFMSDIRVFPGKRDAASRAFSASEGAASGFAHSIEERSLRRSVASVLCERCKSVLCDEPPRVLFTSFEERSSWSILECLIGLFLENVNWMLLFYFETIPLIGHL